MIDLSINFTGDEGEVGSLGYRVESSNFCQKWFRKLKRIHRLPPSPGDSNLSIKMDPSPSRVLAMLQEVCDIAAEEPVSIDITRQDQLNWLHEHFFEKMQHIFVEKALPWDPLHRLHREIHRTEDLNHGKSQLNGIEIGWAQREGPMMEICNCHDYYDRQGLKVGNLYMMWSELGKWPTKYHLDGEPNDQNRFNQLSRPNIHHRAKFICTTRDLHIQPFNQEFLDWFQRYRIGWLAHHNLSDWSPHDEQSGVLLARPVESIDLEEFFREHHTFHSITIGPHKKTTI